MTASVTIRHAKTEDIDSILRLWQEMMAYHAKRDPIFTVPAEGPGNSRKWIGECIRNEKACVVVAEAGGEIVGYSIAIITPYPPVLALKEYGEVYDLAVTAPHQRKGAGEALFQHIKEWMAARGVKRIEARVAVTNEISTKFWRKLGLRPYLEVMYCELQPGRRTGSRRFYAIPFL